MTYVHAVNMHSATNHDHLFLLIDPSPRAHMVVIMSHHQREILPGATWPCMYMAQADVYTIKPQSSQLA